MKRQNTIMTAVTFPRLRGLVANFIAANFDPISLAHPKPKALLLSLGGLPDLPLDLAVQLWICSFRPSKAHFEIPSKPFRFSAQPSALMLFPTNLRL